MSPPQPEKVLDSASGVLYTRLVKLWPLVTEEEDGHSYYNGSILLDSDLATRAVDFKLRVQVKLKHKKMLRSHEGQGELQPKNLHRIGIRVREEAIGDSRLLLHLDGRKLFLDMHKCQLAEAVYRPQNPQVEEEAKSRWERVDSDLLKNLPSGVADCIRDGQRHNVRRRIFHVVYPLVRQMLARLGRSSDSQQQLGQPVVDYFEVWEEDGDVMDHVMEYVLQLLEDRAIGPQTDGAQ